jgi:hypothetical protein
VINARLTILRYGSVLAHPILERREFGNFPAPGGYQSGQLLKIPFYEELCRSSTTPKAASLPYCRQTTRQVAASLTIRTYPHKGLCCSVPAAYRQSPNCFRNEGLSSVPRGRPVCAG